MRAKKFIVICDCGTVMKETVKWLSKLPFFSTARTYYCKNCEAIIHTKSKKKFKKILGKEVKL